MNDPTAPAAALGTTPYRADDVIADKYQLVSVIGEGGMGSVWLARNLVLHVDVALKLVHRSVASEEASQRLLVEARAAARLQHASIVRVHDFGTTAAGDPFIVMELLNGESLADVLARKDCLPAVNTVQMLLPILSALSAAHAEGIVHRDLKPENIILVADDSGVVVPKLVDFGIAKVPREKVITAADGNDEEQPEQLVRRLTKLGVLMGSPSYLSPEQARGDPNVDERADIWAVSVMLYETMAGGQPFVGETIDKLLLKILLDRPAPTTDLGVGDEELWRIIEQGLQKNRNNRWKSARDLGEALARWLVTQGADTDIAGAALRQHWLQDQAARPLSMAPPPMREKGSPSPATREPSGEVATAVAGGARELPERVAAPAEASAPAPPTPAALTPQRRVLLVAAVLLALVVPIGMVVVILNRSGLGTPASDPAATSAAPPTASGSAQVELIQPTGGASAAASAAAPGSAVGSTGRPGRSARTASATDPSAAAPPPATSDRPAPRPAGSPGRGNLPLPDRPNF